MLRRFLKDSVIYGASTLLSRGASLLLLPLYTRVLRPEDYGVLDLLSVFATLVGVTVALEVSQGVARFYPDARSGAESRAFASTALWFSVAVYGAFALAGWAGARPLGELLLGRSGETAAVRAAVAYIAANGVFLLIQSQLRWQLRPVPFAVVSNTYTLLSLGLAVYLVVFAGWGVRGIFWGQAAGSVVAAGLGLFLARDAFGFTFSGARLAELLRFSTPLVPSSMAVVAAAYIDRFILNGLMGIDAVGLYGVGYRLATVATLLLMPVQAALTPLVMARFRDPDTPRQLARIFRLFVAAGLFACLAATVFAREIVGLMAAPSYIGAAVTLPFLFPAVLLSGMYVLAPGLIIAKETGRFALLNVGIASANAGLNFALIPVLGLAGAAVATLLSSAGGFAVLMALSQRRYAVPHGWKPLAAATGIVIAVGSGAVFLPAAEAADLGLLLLKVGALLVVGTAVLLVSAQQDARRALLSARRRFMAGPSHVGDAR